MGSARGLIPLLFGGTLALSAALLFSVQPLVAKAWLPYLGGTPAVWNTCLLFFQAVLLVGYASAHAVAKLRGRLILAAHGGLILLSGWFLPPAVAGVTDGLGPWDGSPALWLLLHPAMSLGLPVFVLSSTAPLLQDWFAGLRHPSARDPYLLYAASNAGSLCGLLASPLLAEAALAFALPTVLCWLPAAWPVWFALAAGGIFLGSATFPGPHGRTLYAERNFFGVSRVTVDRAGDSHRLVHGHTPHGRQFLDPKRAMEPAAYYHRAGPAGDIFRVAEAQRRDARVAVVGLGAGVLMAYARPDQHWTFYEIDPAVVRIASDPRDFMARALGW